MRTKRKKECGIYILISKSQRDLFYIGASEDLHLRKYQHNKPASSHSGLRSHQRRYGNKDLIFKIIHYCDPCYLQFWEQYYISEYCPILNINKFASSISNGKDAQKLAFTELSAFYFSEEKQILEYCINLNY